MAHSTVTKLHPCFRASVHMRWKVRLLESRDFQCGATRLKKNEKGRLQSRHSSAVLASVHIQGSFEQRGLAGLRPRNCLARQPSLWGRSFRWLAQCFSGKLLRPATE